MRIQIDADAIKLLIPHRAPFLFVNKAWLSSDNNSTITGEALWHREHPILLGHFPSNPVVPGVCQLEAVAQLTGVLIASQSIRTAETRFIGVLAAVRKAQFKTMLLPNQVLEIEVNVRLLSSNFYLVKAISTTDSKLVLDTELMIAIKRESP